MYISYCLQEEKEENGRERDARKMRK